MTNVLDGKELANGSYTYTTKLQDREQKEERNFKGGEHVGETQFYF